jgi:hypothetical protein
MGYDPSNPRHYDARHFSSEEAERFNPEGPINFQPPVPVQDRMGWVSYWAIFSIPGLFCILREGVGFLAAVLGAMVILVIGTTWARYCPFQNYVVKNGIMFCGFFTLISAGIGLFIHPKYLFVIAIAVAIYAAYRVTRGEKT